MRSARDFFALLAALANLAACSGRGADPQGPAVVNPGSTLTFTPSAVYANRFASVCGVPSPPPYGPGNVFSQLAVGAGSPGPLTGFGVDMEQAVAPGTTYDLIPVAPVSVQNPNGTDRSQNALASDGVLSFQFQWSPSNPGEIDPNPLDHVTVTIIDFPSADGEPMTVRYVLHFTDQQTLDVTISGDTQLDAGGCAAG